MMKALLLFFVLAGFSTVGIGQNIKTIAGNGTGGYSGDGGYAISASFNWPYSIKFDVVGNMYISDWKNHVIRKINTHGIISTIVGTSVMGYSGDNGPASAAKLSGPTDVTFDLDGNMFIDDNGNNVIRKVNPSGIISTIAGTGSGGYNGDNIPATTAKLNYPLGLVFSAGNLYFSDELNRRVRKINTKTGIITTIAGTGIAGNDGDGGPATAARLRLPCWLAVSSTGDLFIPDFADYKVRKVNSAGIITTIAGNGTFGNDGDGLPATAASIGACVAITIDLEGNIFISNNATCSIRKVNTSGIITTIAGNNICGYSGDGGPATAAQINASAVCSAIDPSGNLYFADSHNNVIRRITYNSIGVDDLANMQLQTTIYPNPAKNELTIDCGGQINGHVSITNAIGQQVYLSTSSINRIDVSQFVGGLYFVKVNEANVGSFLKE